MSRVLAVVVFLFCLQLASAQFQGFFDGMFQQQVVSVLFLLGTPRFIYFLLAAAAAATPL
jgi:hypothetical protein